MRPVLMVPFLIGRVDMCHELEPERRPIAVAPLLVRPGEDPNRVSHENPVDASEPAAVDATEAETGPSP